MTDTIRVLADQLTALADNTSGNITPQNIRDVVLSLYPSTYAGNPNGNVAGTFQGQEVMDTTNGILWYCRTTGIAASATWVPQVGLRAVVATGTADAMSVAIPGASLLDGTIIAVKSIGANLSPTPTLNLNATGNTTITTRGGQTLQPGDNGVAGFIALYEYRSSSTNFEMLNPAAAPGASLTSTYVNTAKLAVQGLGLTGGPMYLHQAQVDAFNDTTGVSASSANVQYDLANHWYSNVMSGSDANSTFLDHFNSPAGPVLDSNTYNNGPIQVYAPNITVATSGMRIGTGCLSFDGSTSYLQAPKGSITLGSGNFSIEFIFTPADNGYNGGNARMLFHTLVSTAADSLQIVYSSQQLAVYTSTAVIAYCGSVSISSPHSVALVRNGSTLTLYLDGSQIGQATGFGATLSDNNVVIGKNATSSNQYYYGTIDEFRISNTNRTIPAGIPTTQFTPDNNTLMLLHCDPANGDVTSSNLPLTWGSGATTTSYKFGSSGAYFNGVNSWIKGPDANAAYQLTGDFTYECFFQTTSTYATNCALIETGAASTVTRFCIALIGGQIRGDSNVAGAIFAACGNYIQGVFNHIAVSRTSSTMSVYLNGTRIYTGTVAQSFSVGNLRIGALYDGFSVFNGVMDCVRIINGTGIYSGATITVPTTALTAVTNTSLLLQFDVQDGALKDVSNSDVSLAATGLTITASNPPPVNTYSGAFNGSTSFVQGAYSAATQFAGPFTVEGFVRFNSVGSDAMIFENRASASGTPGFCVYLHSGNIIFNSGGNPRITGTSTPSINTWYHWAVSRDSSNNINMWFNGTWQGTTWNSSTLAYTDARLRLGVNCVDTALLNGNMSSIRINNSVAVYSGTSSITVPTARLTAITGTSLLINFDNLNPDSSTNNADLTWNCVTTRLSRFGNSALMLDGSTSGRVYSSSAPGISGNAAMGMDVWYYPITTGVSGYGIILGAAVSGGAILGHVNGAYTVSISRAFIVDTLVSTVPMVPNTWNHIEWDKTSAGGTSYLFLNGLAAGSAADNASYTSGALSISNSTAHTIISGLIDEPRISSTYRGHSSAFTPPTVEYGGTAATSSLQATAFTALTNPTTGALVARWKDDSGGAALNTDLIGEISVDGGSTWTAITLADQGPWNVVADSRVLYGKATLPGTGANIVSRLRTANGKAQKHRALSTFVS